MSKFKYDKKFKAIILSLMIVILVSFQLVNVLADNVNNYTSTLKVGETLEGTGFFTGDTVRVSGNVNGTTFASGSDIEVNGIIDGDLFVAGQNIAINGTVKGSLFVSGQNININGNVEDNIYSAGSVLKIKSKNNGDAFLAGQNILMESESSVARDLFIGASKISSNGSVGGNLFGSAENISVTGVVDKNADLNVMNLDLKNAEVKGNLKYSSSNKANISSDSKVLGETDWKKTEPKKDKTLLSMALLIQILLSIAGLTLIWFLVKLIRPEFWTDLSSKIFENPLKTLGVGALTLLLTPIISVILMITVIGLPLGIILLVLYGLSMYLSKIIVAVSIGSWLREKFNWTEKHNGLWLILLGLFILSVLGIIPILGLIVKLIVVVAGLGSIVLSAKK